MEPRSRPVGLAAIFTTRCWYFRSIITGPVPCEMLATLPSRMGRPPSPVTNSRLRSSGADRNGSSSWTTMLYWLPVRGSVKIDGFTLTLLLSEKSAAWAMSRCERPAVAAFSRSTTMSNCG